MPTRGIWTFLSNMALVITLLREELKVAVSKKKQAELEAAAAIAAILAQHGVVDDSLHGLETTHGDPVDAKELDDSPQRQMFHGQGVIKSLEFPTEFRITKRCKECKDPFTTNYYSVAYCSLLCCELDLKKHFGLAWKPHARIAKERWEVLAEPEIVTYKALQAMKMIVDRVEADLGHPIDYEERAFSRLPQGLLKEELPSLASELLPAQEHPLSDIQTIPVQEEYSAPEEDDSLAWLFAESS